MVHTDDGYRALLDEFGCLPEAARVADTQFGSSFMVFSQERDARVDIVRLDRQARQWFGASVKLAIPKAETTRRRFDVARVAVSTPEGLEGVRTCSIRPSDHDDRQAAEAAETRSHDTPHPSTGMALLARRCPILWLVAAEGDDDAVSLLLAAILATTYLGPVLPVKRDAVFGVRTARERLERLVGMYGKG